MQTDCIIWGGGAAGLAAAAALANSALRITLVERQDRVGKKLLSTGNGRCNLSNKDMRAALYGDSASFVADVYQATPPEAVHEFFARLGLATLSEEGRLYPRSLQAASVLDVLRLGCEGVQFRTGCTVTGLTPSRRGGFCVQLENGEGLFAPVVLCAPGGSAAPSMGTDGSGVRLLTALGHTAIPPVPALVQLCSSHPSLRALKGIRARAALTLLIGGKSVAHEDGELLFADYGVSGVCVFQLSRLAARALEAGKTVVLCVDLLPDAPSNFLRIRIAQHPERPAQQLFTGVFHRLLGQALLKEAHVTPDIPCGMLTAAQCDTLEQAMHAFMLPITGTQGFAHAQVTSGGIRTEEIDPATMASRLFDGLYLAGEVIDVDGPCGGYNLHFAFASALTAARAIRTRM